jgi:hypothetical protein
MKRRVIFVDPEQWGRTNNPKEHTMTNKPISKYQAPDGMILVLAPNFDFFYDQIEGQDVIGLTAHDDRLGPIAFLFTPEAAEQAGRNLIEMATTELDRLRAGYANRFEG